LTSRRWDERAQVPAAMLNPALMGLLIASAATGYTRKSGRNMPWELVFIVAPLVLHKATREALPGITTHLTTWVGRHAHLCATLPYRAQALRDPVLEGFRFAVRQNWVELDGADVRAAIQRIRVADVGDARELVRKAEFAGRWLSLTPRTSTIYALFGVTP